jgi:hypothetical protein
VQLGSLISLAPIAYEESHFEGAYFLIDLEFAVAVRSAVFVAPVVMADW